MPSFRYVLLPNSCWQRFLIYLTGFADTIKVRMQLSKRARMPGVRLIHSGLLSLQFSFTVRLPYLTQPNCRHQSVVS